MLNRLPINMLLEVLSRTNDVKANVAAWCSCNDIHRLQNTNDFWNAMCYFQCPIDNNKINETKSYHKTYWLTEYWKHFKNLNGCAYCMRCNLDNTYGKVKICEFEIAVCNRCKNILGDNMIHKDQLEYWQINLMNKLKNSKNCPSHSIFKNYYGESQIARCKNYFLKCSECLKNIRNIRCPNSRCGTCCQCKYHKSHYEQANPFDSIVSFNIANLVRHSNTKKKTLMIVHKYV